jgi:hypothetical protein
MRLSLPLTFPRGSKGSQRAFCEVYDWRWKKYQRHPRQLAQALIGQWHEYARVRQ